MRIAIYDNDESTRKQLANILKEMLRERGITVFADLFEDTHTLIGELGNGSGFDVVFLQADACGINAAYDLRRLHYNGDIVFCSSDADFAIEGYEVGACGYLLMPFHPERLTRLVQRLAKSRQTDCLIIRQQRAVARIPYHTIVYIESRNTKCLIHGIEGECYTVYRRLDDLERELNDHRFLRSHQSFLVNMDHVLRAHIGFEMVNGMTVAIRQRDLRRIRDCYENYVRRCVSAIK